MWIMVIVATGCVIGVAWLVDGIVQYYGGDSMFGWLRRFGGWVKRKVKGFIGWVKKEFDVSFKYDFNAGKIIALVKDKRLGDAGNIELEVTSQVITRGFWETIIEKAKQKAEEYLKRRLEELKQ